MGDERRISTNRLQEAIPINRRGARKVLQDVHLDHMLVKYILSVFSTVFSVGLREPMAPKPIPEFGEMPFVSLFS